MKAYTEFEIKRKNDLEKAWNGRVAGSLGTSCRQTEKDGVKSRIKCADKLCCGAVYKTVTDATDLTKRFDEACFEDDKKEVKHALAWDSEPQTHMFTCI